MRRHGPESKGRDQRKHRVALLGEMMDVLDADQSGNALCAVFTPLLATLTPS